MKVFLKIRYYKSCIMIELIQANELIFLKVRIVKNALFVTTPVFDHGFGFQYSVCNGIHDLLMLCVDIIAILL